MLAEKMAQTPQAAETFLMDISQKLTDRLAQDLATLGELKGEDCAERGLPHDGPPSPPLS